MRLETVATDQIQIKEVTRKKNWEKDVAELAASIKSEGLLQPPLLLKKGGQYEVIFGGRRVAACKQLRMKSITALVIDTDSDRAIWKKRLAENAARKNLEPLEEAAVFKKLKEEVGITSKELAATLGVSEGYISQRLQLLKLPKAAQTALQENKIDFAQARSLPKGTKPTKRGRPAKNPAVKAPRSVSEIKKAAALIDTARVQAIEAGNTLRQEFFNGMLRALGWAGGMVDKLL